jgi:Flp pilus assembly protein TadG
VKHEVVLSEMKRMWRMWSRRGESGSALVEVALTFPVLMVLVTGIAAFGIGFNNQIVLTNAVGTGGQYLQLIRTSTTDPCKDTLTAISNAAPNLTASNITLSFSFNGTPVSGNTCAGDQSYLVQGQPVTVLAKYPCVLPIYATKFATGCQLTATVAEYEY